MSIVAASLFSFFFFNDTATTEIYTLSLHDALPILTLGVATANSVLLITYADDLRREGRSALEAALEAGSVRSEEHTSELQSRLQLVCRLLLVKKKHTYVGLDAPARSARHTLFAARV